MKRNLTNEFKIGEKFRDAYLGPKLGTVCEVDENTVTLWYNSPTDTVVYGLARALHVYDVNDLVRLTKLERALL